MIFSSVESQANSHILSAKESRTKLFCCSSFYGCFFIRWFSSDEDSKQIYLGVDLADVIPKPGEISSFGD